MRSHSIWLRPYFLCQEIFHRRVVIREFYCVPLRSILSYIKKFVIEEFVIRDTVYTYTCTYVPTRYVCTYTYKGLGDAPTVMLSALVVMEL